VRRPRAAVDCGTNSTRLLVVDADGHDVIRRTEITRLGAGVDATGHLDDQALDRTLAVVEEYRDAWRAAGVDDRDVRIAATAAVRDADNRDRYFTAVRDLTGVDARVLSGDEEARLSFLGAVGALSVPLPVLVVDIGGGSTELVIGDTDVRAAHSMQVGAVRVTERHLRADPPTDEQVMAAMAMVDDALDDAAAELLAQDPSAALEGVATVVGVAGTITTLAALHGDADSPDDPGLHGVVIPAADLMMWSEQLLAMTVAERRAIRAMPAGRADVIAGGAVVAARVMARTGAEQLVVSVADILDGLVAGIG
jgi:exopolyphosphatase / guanosine-5'-triphosphate,3'-diphosphate pyrophosphatase